MWNKQETTRELTQMERLYSKYTISTSLTEFPIAMGHLSVIVSLLAIGDSVKELEIVYLLWAVKIYKAKTSHVL